jgi:hypothetical protein
MLLRVKANVLTSYVNSKQIGGTGVLSVRCTFTFNSWLSDMSHLLYIDQMDMIVLVEQRRLHFFRVGARPNPKPAPITVQTRATGLLEAEIERHRRDSVEAITVDFDRMRLEALARDAEAAAPQEVEVRGPHRDDAGEK